MPTSAPGDVARARWASALSISDDRTPYRRMTHPDSVDRLRPRARRDLEVTSQGNSPRSSGAQRRPFGRSR